MKMKAEIRALRKPKAKEHPGLPAKPQEFWEEAGNRLSLAASEGTNAADTLILNFQSLEL